MKTGGAVYILTNETRTVLYIGVTSDLLVRIQQHKQKIDPFCFTAKYNCINLIYYETFLRIEEAILREKRLKNWHRKWKENLINEFNPQWLDLFDRLD